MKVVVSILCLLLLNTPLSAVTVLLHLDVNQTLIATDPAGNKPLDRVMKMALARHPTSTFRWDGEHDTTYTKYVETVLHPGPRSNRSIKYQRQETLDHYLQVLEAKKHPKAAEIAAAYTKIKQRAEQNYVLPAFFHLVDLLDQHPEIEYKIVLRTFGNDMEKVIAEIQEKRPQIQFIHRGRFESGTLVLADQKKLSSQAEIYTYLRDTSGGHFALQDNYKEWNRDEERARSGKKFVYDPSDKDMISIFVDDHVKGAHLDEEDIVAPYTPDGELHSPRELIGHTIFTAEIVDMLLDDDDIYFAQMVDRALEHAGRPERLL